jgi:protein ImuB
MRRLVSVWLPYWRTERLEWSNPSGKSPEKHSQGALAIIESEKGGRRLAAVNQAAEAGGLSPGMRLTDACAILPSLQTVPAAPIEEARDLKKLAVWCQLYTPWTAPKPPDGIALDVTGASHLLGGEQELLDDLTSKLQRLGLTVRAAMAGAFGAAWALSRYGNANRIVTPCGEEARLIAPLPVCGLRLDEAGCALLNRLGLTTIGQVLDLPRSALRSRLGPTILLRLDQALGEQREPLSPLQPETVYAARASFAEPVSSLDNLLYATERLAQQVTAQLKGDMTGARRFRLHFYDTQGGFFAIAVTLAKPSHEHRHVLRLFREKFTRLESRFDDNLAFDAASLFATRVERLAGRQTELDGGVVSSLDREDRLAALLDRLTARLGSEAVRRFAFRESHIPERAAITVPVLHEAPPLPALRRPRPLLLLPHAEPVSVLAEVPDYPPRRFTWRRITYRIVKAEGPERLSPEWWVQDEGHPALRDYFTVEDESGRRFWLYREGLYGAESVPRWYMHGLFS